MSTKLKPLVGQQAVAEVYIPDLSDDNLGQYVKKIIFKGFINNGYAMRIQINNANFALLDGLFEGKSGGFHLLQRIRSNPISVTLKLKHHPGRGEGRRESTRKIKAYITMIYPHGAGEIDYVEIIAIDPLNYFLRIGDGWGGAFEGSINSAMQQLITKYAPQISSENIEIAGTMKNAGKVWWAMRRSPRDMLSHLIYMSTAFSESKTPWVMGISGKSIIGDHIKIGPQITFPSNKVGYYSKMTTSGDGDIISWEAVLNPSLGHYEMGLVTAGVDARLGVNYDPTTKSQETNNPAIVSDHNTSNKYVPINNKNGKALRGTIRPEKDTFKAGMFGRSYVESPPEYTANDVEEPYVNYFNTYAKTKYMQHVPKLFTIDLKIKGHGIYDDTIGLGADTVYIDWQNNFKKGARNYFLSGNWLVYGFEHTWYKNNWTTIVRLSKPDINAIGKPVGMS